MDVTSIDYPLIICAPIGQEHQHFKMRPLSRISGIYDFGDAEVFDDIHNSLFLN